MNIDDPDLTPAGALPRPVLGPHRVPVATFTPTQTPHPDAIWEPLTRVTGMTADGQQGDPFGGYRPGHGLEHEPLDSAEKAGQHTAQNARKDDTQPPHLTAGAHIRAALRGGIVG